MACIVKLNENLLKPAKEGNIQVVHIHAAHIMDKGNAKDHLTIQYFITKTVNNCISLVPVVYSVLDKILNTNSFCTREGTNKMEKDMEMILLLNPEE